MKSLEVWSPPIPQKLLTYQPLSPISQPHSQADLQTTHLQTDPQIHPQSVQLQTHPQETHLQPDSPITNMSPGSPATHSQPDYQATNIQPGSHATHLQPDSQTTNIQPDSQITNIQPSSQATQPDSQVILQDFQTTNIQPVSQETYLQPDLQATQPDSLATNIQLQTVLQTAQLQTDSQTTTTQLQTNLQTTQLHIQETNLQPDPPTIHLRTDPQTTNSQTDSQIPSRLPPQSLPIDSLRSLSTSAIPVPPQNTPVAEYSELNFEQRNLPLPPIPPVLPTEKISNYFEDTTEISKDNVLNQSTDESINDPNNTETITDVSAPTETTAAPLFDERVVPKPSPVHTLNQTDIVSPPTTMDSLEIQIVPNPISPVSPFNQTQGITDSQQNQDGDVSNLSPSTVVTDNISADTKKHVHFSEIEDEIP